MIIVYEKINFVNKFVCVCSAVLNNISKNYIYIIIYAHAIYSNNYY
jgi:hypothetical protein